MVIATTDARCFLYKSVFAVCVLFCTCIFHCNQSMLQGRDSHRWRMILVKRFPRDGTSTLKLALSGTSVPRLESRKSGGGSLYFINPSEI